MDAMLCILILIFCTAGDCRNEMDFKNDIFDDDETCSKGRTSWMDSPAALMQSAMESVLPSSGERNAEPTFLYFSHGSGQGPDYVTNANFTSWSTNAFDFDPKIKTILIISGFKDSYAPWTRKLKDALILREDCNVFLVEYEPSRKYGDATKNAPEIGKQVATFIRNLVKSKHLDLQRIHIVGHSVGAHIAGFAGMEIKMTDKLSLGRVTGLDPAGPGFYGTAPDQRLDATDASFVDIIHTNRGCNRLEGFGFSDACGHFDFYPNGGQAQPGCLTTAQFIDKMDFSLAKGAFKYLFGKPEKIEKEVLANILCSHIRAYDFFTASISNGGCKFRSVQCSSWNRYASGQCNGNDQVAMGYYADEYKDKAEGVTPKKFYLETTLHNCI